MTHQRDIGKFPTERPPDPENESPGAVGTATGAEVRSLLEKTNQSRRKPNVNVPSAAALSTGRSAFSRRRRPVRRRYDPQQGVARALIAAGENAERGAAS